MPSFNRCVVNNELIFLLVFRLCSDINGSPNVLKCEKNLFKVVFSLKSLLEHFSLFDSSVSEERPAEELIFLGEPLEKDVEDPLGVSVSGVR